MSTDLKDDLSLRKVCSMDDKDAIDLLEGILGSDPQAYLTDSIVYQVTQVELLKFAKALVENIAMVTPEKN